MRRPYRGLLLAIGLLLACAAVVVAQGFFPGTGGGGTQFGQFPGGQGGISGFGGRLGLLPGQEDRLALYCIDLFNDAPTDRDEYRSLADARAVVTVGGRQMPLDQALSTGLLSVRGHDPTVDQPRRDGHEWIDLYVRNNTAGPVSLTYPAGYAFIPKGRPAPALAPGLIRMLETAYDNGLTGSDTLAYAMWASRGFTREDVEVTEIRPLPDREVATVQKLLDAGDIDQRFDRDRGSYERLYAARETALGDDAQPLNGAATLPGGTNATVSGKRTESGLAVVAVQPSRSSSQPLRYAARVLSIRNGKAELELVHLKSGRPLQVNGGRLTVRLSAV